MPTVIGTLSKTKNEKLDFSINWANVLVSEEVITELSVGVSGLILSTPAPSINGTITTWWLSGGNLPTTYCTVKITTNLGRIYERQLNITIV